MPRRPLSFVSLLLTCLVILGGSSERVLADAMQRLRMEHLKAVHDAVEAIQAERRPVEIEPGDYTDYRAQLHVHSAFSHDSRSTLDEVLAAAKTCGTKVLMFSEHPADHYDYFKDGHRGMHDGILVIPGAETGGYLAWPTRSIQDETTEGPQAFADLVRKDDGLIFLCHLEERMDWDIAGLTGSEIYNTHADAMDEKRFLASLRNPLLLLALLPALEKYPQECFAAIFDYPADYLKRFDELCQKFPHTGVSANDSHHNQGVKATLDAEGKVQIVDLLGEKVAELDPKKVPLLGPLVRGKQPGDTILSLDLDPYERSFRHVSTHLLMKEQTQEGVWDALKTGRAYVGFDWISDPTGFVYFARQGKDGARLEMGSQIELPATSADASEDKQLTLETAAPLAGIIKVLRNGEVVKEDRAAKLSYTVTEPGNYRVEVWVPIAGELKPWILSNPIYVRAQQ